MRKALLGLLLAWSGPASAADADDDGIANRKDACPDQAEVFNGHADDDGCPDELGILVVTVKDLHGEPVQGAAVSVGDSDKQTDPYGVATFPELLPGLTYAVRVDHSDFVDEDVQNVIPPEGRYEQVVTLDWKPVPIEVRAVEPRSGEALDAVVRMDGPGFVAPQRTGDDGEAVVLLRPGAWTLTVYADHHLQAKRSFELEPGAETVEARFELAPTWTGFADLALPFSEGSASVERALQDILDDLILELFAWPEVRLDVRGHPDQALEELSAQRAGAVWAWLVQAGVPPGQVSVEALGARPLVPPGHPRAEELNRTVGFDVTVPDAPAQGGDADTDTDTEE